MSIYYIALAELDYLKGLPQTEDIRARIEYWTEVAWREFPLSNLTQ